MDKTLADCWAYLQQTPPVDVYFAPRELVLDDSLRTFWRIVLLPDGRTVITMPRQTLLGMAAQLTRTEAAKEANQAAP